MSHLISFSGYQVDDVISFKILLGLTSKLVAHGEKKREDENTNI